MCGLPQSRPWENDQSRVTISPTAPARLARSRRCWSMVPAAAPVHLEEGLRVGGDDLLDRLAGERAEAHRRAPGGGGPGDGDLAVGVDGLHAGGRDDAPAATIGWPMTVVAWSRSARLVGDVGREPSSFNAGEVVVEGGALLRAGQQGAVHRRGQPLLGPALGLGDGLEPRVGHQATPHRRRAGSPRRVDRTSWSGPPSPSPAWSGRRSGGGSCRSGRRRRGRPRRGPSRTRGRGRRGAAR